MVERISILGTGLLGTSVGLALRAGGFSGSISGWNRSADQAQLALQMGAIDSVAADPIEAARASQVVLLAVPIYATLDFMEKLACELGSEHLVTDVGSTKRVISEAAARLYNTPERAAFLPGHPMAGKERGGAALGDANLFRGAVWIFTPGTASPSATGQKVIGQELTGQGVIDRGAKGQGVIDRGVIDQGANGQGVIDRGVIDQGANGQGVKGTGFSPYENPPSIAGALAPDGISPTGAALIQAWRELVVSMGAKTLDLDPVRHDELVAWVSHLPQFTATALSALLEEQVGDAPELKDVGGRALREMTRLGASPYSMWRDIASTNTEAVERALFALEQRIAHLRENLRTPGLREEFEQANKFRRD